MPRIPDRQFFNPNDYKPSFGDDYSAYRGYGAGSVPVPGAPNTNFTQPSQGVPYGNIPMPFGSQYKPNSGGAQFPLVGNGRSTNPAGEHSGSRIGDINGSGSAIPVTPKTPVDDPLGIYDQLMKLALQGSKAQYDIKGATRGINAAYDPQFGYLDKLAAAKKAAELQNEKDIASIFGVQKVETKKHGANTAAAYLKQLAETQSGIDQRKSKASAEADQRIAEMTAELTKLGQDNLIADRKQQILNQRDQTLERIGAQGQSLVNNIQSMKGANNDWYNEAQDVATSQQNVGIRDQKALLVNALMQIDQSRAGLLSDRAKALADVSAQARAAQAQSGPNINTILSILGQRNALSKDLNSQGTARTSALDKLIQGGGMNGAKAYAQANGLGDNYFNALSDFISNQANQDPNFNLQSGNSYKYDSLIQQYANDNGLSPQQLMSMWQVYTGR